LDIPLPEQVGSYVLELSKGSSAFAAIDEIRFTIATFQEDKFQLNVQTDAEIAAGGQFDVKINAAYLSGQPLNDAKGVWTLRAVPEPFKPKGYDGFDFNLGPQSEFSEGYFKEAVSLHSVSDQGQVTLDAKGMSGLTRDLRGGRSFMSPLALEFGLEVTDASHQTIYRGARSLLHSSDFYLGVQQSRSWVNEGEDFPLSVVAVGVDGKPVHPPAPVELTVEGVSKGKAIKYGKPFVDLIEKYVTENNIEKPDDFVMKSVANKSSNKIYIIQNVDKKITLETIAKNKDLRLDSLLEEMETIAASGTKLNLDYAIDEWLDEYDQEEILEYFKSCETSSLQIAQEELSENNYTWEQLKIMRIKFLSVVGN
jgi:hypothetical protein